MKKRIDTTICGAICLLLGWGVATLIHECCHLAAAHSLGLEASLGALTLTTGSVFVYGDMTSTQTAIIALAGSLGLVIAGVLMVRLSGSPPVLKMIGIIFLCRSYGSSVKQHSVIPIRFPFTINGLSQTFSLKWFSIIISSSHLNESNIFFRCSVLSLLSIGIK